MALPISVLMALVMFCCRPACFWCCDLPLSHSNQETFTLLNQMERISLLSCLKDRTDFRFPQILMDMNQLEKTQAAVLLYEMLQQTFNLFSRSDSLEAWDETFLDKFLFGLYQQLNDLEICFEKDRRVEQIPLGTENSVKSYFQGIGLYLKEKEHSLCAWEVVRVEIRKCFLFINMLTGKLQT
ncbi:interferon alpha-6-like [Elephas maximus indicus]|uniref:interferon alpha-6-like n=1 Tax=Elephas maximus indicus TaxID=99487 RepID=UPI002117173B|nr:interferon alpha-6-like [Elephas maximus indicus]